MRKTFPITPMPVQNPNPKLNLLIYMATKVGIIGAGGMVGYHIAGFKEAGAEIAAIADMNLEAAQKVAEKNGIGQALSLIHI